MMFSITISMMRLSLLTFSITTLSITIRKLTLCKMGLRIMTFNTYAECHYAECRIQAEFAECYIIKWDTCNKSSLLLKLQTQNTQKLQLLTMTIKIESIYKSYWNAKSWMAWVQRPNGLIKVDGNSSAFKRGYLDYCRECFIEANINNWSKSLKESCYAECGGAFHSILIWLETCFWR